MLLKSPGFTIIAILALALGIGANTAIFSVVNAVLLRPLPYPEPDRLMILRESFPAFPNGSVSYPNYLDWREGQRSFTDLALVTRESFNFSAPGSQTPPERVAGGRVTWNFSRPEMKPLIGRDLTERRRPGRGAGRANQGEFLEVAALVARPTCSAAVVVIDGVTREIVGVLPAAICFPRSAEIGPLRRPPERCGRIEPRKSSGLLLVRATETWRDLETGQPRPEQSSRSRLRDNIPTPTPAAGEDGSVARVERG